MMVYFLCGLLCVYFLQLERQLHEDEEFARTLAMLDETPKKKKVILSSGGGWTHR